MKVFDYQKTNHILETWCVLCTSLVLHDTVFRINCASVDWDNQQYTYIYTGVAGSKDRKYEKHQTKMLLRSQLWDCLVLQNQPLNIEVSIRKHHSECWVKASPKIGHVENDAKLTGKSVAICRFYLLADWSYF